MVQALRCSCTQLRQAVHSQGVAHMQLPWSPWTAPPLLPFFRFPLATTFCLLRDSARPAAWPAVAAALLQGMGPAPPHPATAAVAVVVPAEVAPVLPAAAWPAVAAAAAVQRSS